MSFHRCDACKTEMAIHKLTSSAPKGSAHPRLQTPEFYCSGPFCRSRLDARTVQLASHIELHTHFAGFDRESGELLTGATGLWLLERKDGGANQYDLASAFVVRADTELKARYAASNEVEAEHATWGVTPPTAAMEARVRAWLDPAETRCTALGQYGPEGVILSAFKHG